ncbi:hypothetical protein [Roseiconus lacunae]|uniref:hypothetical protein n=1 Tax=Roseiconus lacunae TaxID=2605694 RepID=UPI0011F3536F
MNCRSIVLATMVAICLLVPSGCKEVSQAFVHLDNGHDRPVTIFVDGIYAGRVESGHSRRLTLPLGHHEFFVKDDQRVVYSAAHRLDSGDRPYRTPVFILNPDGNNRYCELQLAMRPIETGHEDGLVTLTSHQEPPLDDQCIPTQVIKTLPEKTLPEKILPHDITTETLSAAEVRAQYKAILRRFNLRSPTTFFQVEHAEHQFSPIPIAAFPTEETEPSPSALARIPHPLHRYLSEAFAVDHPTRQDLEMLQKAESAAIACVPVR